MTEAVFLTVITALAGAITKLWVDLRAMVLELKVQAEKHSACEVSVAALKGELAVLRVELGYLQQRDR